MHGDNRFNGDGQWNAQNQAQHYQRNRRANRRKRRQPPVILPRMAVAAVCAVVMIVALVKLISWGSGVISTRQTNRELRAMRDQAAMQTVMITQEPIMTPYPHQTAAPTVFAAPTAGDFAPQRTPVSLVTATPVPQDKLFYQAAGDMLPELKSLYQKNSDLVGWLTIPGVVDLPVVYRDNTYYLDKDFNKNASRSGTLFLDQHHPLKSTTQHLVIHGHNMNDGSMFGLLAHYKDKKYIRDHGVITFSTLYEKHSYAVIAVALTPENTQAADFIPYIGNPTFATDSAFNYYMKKVESGALYRTYLDVQPTDALLTLSTCLDDDRLLVVCRRLRNGESEEDVRRTQRYSIE